MPIRRARCGRCQAKSADNTGCCKGERRQWRKQRTEAGAAVAECEGLLPPKHDAGTATRHYRAFWQRRCRAAAAGAVLEPLGGNCAVLPLCGMLRTAMHTGWERNTTDSWASKYNNFRETKMNPGKCCTLRIENTGELGACSMPTGTQ